MLGQAHPCLVWTASGLYSVVAARDDVTAKGLAHAGRE